MKKALTAGLSLASALSLMLGVSGIALAQEDAAPETEEPVYAAASLKEAAATGKDDASAFTWEGVAWVAEFKTANTVDWGPMNLANATGSFSHNGTEQAQPAAYVTKKDGEIGEDKVMLLANQFGGGTWWSKSAVTFTATEAGQYVLTCDTMEPGRYYDGTAWKDSLNGENGDGHVTVYKNDTKIWPVDKNYASVTSDAPPTFEPLTITLAVGDKIRFEGFGGKVGGDTSDANPNE